MSNNTFIYDFGLRLRKLRESSGLSQAALAKKIGVSKETIYRYENNVQDPSLERAIQLARVLRTSLDYLVGLEDGYILRMPALTEEEQVVLKDFVRVFIENHKN